METIFFFLPPVPLLPANLMETDMIECHSQDRWSHSVWLPRSGGGCRCVCEGEEATVANAIPHGTVKRSGRRDREIRNRDEGGWGRKGKSEFSEIPPSGYTRALAAVGHGGGGRPERSSC